MSRIVVSGYYGFNNAGDEAMLTAILTALRAEEPDVDVTVISGNPTETKNKHAVRSVYRFDARKIYRAFKRMDLLLSGGGSLLQDVTSKKSLLYYLSVLLLAKLMGKRVMLFAQGIGPVHSGVMRALTRFVVSRMDEITVREEDSRQELVRIGIDSSRITVTADAVLGLEPVPLCTGENILKQAGIDTTKPIVGVSVRSWRGDKECFLRLGRVLGRLAEDNDAQILLLPLQNPADIEACQWLKSFVKTESRRIFLLKTKYSTDEFMSIIGNLQLLFGMRLHALIFAAVMRVPLLAISYDPKVDAFVQALHGNVAGTVEDIDAAGVYEQAVKLFERIPKEQEKRISELHDAARVNTIKAFELLRK